MRLRERQRAAMRRAYHRRRAQGRCARCDARARSGMSTCALCGRRESLRRNAYQRRTLGQRPRYADGRGYGPRVSLAAPVVLDAPTDCRRCRGCLMPAEGGLRCLNCGHVIILAARPERART